jgi:IS5 family transposase
MRRCRRPAIRDSAWPVWSTSVSSAPRLLPHWRARTGGRPLYDAVLMFKVLVLQALYGLSDEQAEFQLGDRLSFMRFVGLELHEPVLEAKTIWLYREQLKRAGAIDTLFRRFDAVLAAKGYLAIGGQIIDATIVAAPKQKFTADEKAVIKQGNTPPGWSKAKRRKDRDARWTLKRRRTRPKPEGGAGRTGVAVPVSATSRTSPSTAGMG